MKSPEEIEKLAKEYAKNKYGAGYYPDVYKSFAEGYSQALKDDSDKKYHDEDIRTAFFQGFVAKSTLQKNEDIDKSFNDFLQALKNIKNVI